MKAHAVGRLGLMDVYLPGNRNLPNHTYLVCMYVCMYYFYVSLAHLCSVKKMGKLFNLRLCKLAIMAITFYSECQLKNWLLALEISYAPQVILRNKLPTNLNLIIVPRH